MEAIDPTSPHCHTHIMGGGGGHWVKSTLFEDYLGSLRQVCGCYGRNFGHGVFALVLWGPWVFCSEHNLENKINDCVWQFLCHSLTEYSDLKQMDKCWFILQIAVKMMMNGAGNLDKQWVPCLGPLSVRLCCFQHIQWEWGGHLYLSCNCIDTTLGANTYNFSRVWTEGAAAIVLISTLPDWFV